MSDAHFSVIFFFFYWLSGLKAFVFESDLDQACVSPSLVFLGASEPRDVTLDYTICRIYRNELTLECMMCVLGRNLIQGWFYSYPSSVRAEDSLRVGGEGLDAGSEVLLEPV